MCPLRIGQSSGQVVEAQGALSPASGDSTSPPHFRPRGGQVAVTFCTTSVVSLHPAHTFVNSSFIQLSSNYLI